MIPLKPRRRRKVLLVVAEAEVAGEGLRGVAAEAEAFDVEETYVCKVM